jgi:hypothetical protein
MSEENENQEQKRKLRDSLRGLGQRSAAGARATVRGTLRLISRILKLLIWNPITIGIVCLIIGARIHETGRLAGYFGKDYKGSTVRMSSASCTINGKASPMGVAQDQVIVTYADAEKIEGVIRKTRDKISCKTSETVISTLSLSDLLGREDDVVPDYKLPVAVIARAPEYKTLEKKTLLMSGSCVDLEGKSLPAFTDEKVDVTSVVGERDADGQESMDQFTLTGIMNRVDKAPQTIRCASNNIKYSEYQVAKKGGEGMDLNLEQTQAKSYVGEILVITGTCFPDERTKINKTKRYAFYKLANAKIQVLEHDMTKDGKINRLVGIALDAEFRGDALYCDRVKFPFTFKEYDEDSMKLEKGATAEQIGAPESAPANTAPAAPAAPEQQQ